MTVVDRLLALWDAPPDTRPDPEAGFAALYTDPVLVNGTPTTVAEMVDRARALHAAFTGHEREVLEVVEQPGKLAVAFRLVADPTGPWPTAVGELAPTGRRISTTVIDVLTLTPDGRVASIVMVADELGRLRQAGAM
ncbi:ester cyclase [Pseudonocardia kujensis]|uniref:ester cyclase n=1 Tax=Pseudonocardia kujensis TaxID=1128675 RepID=UPI001E316191|nr:ester cyclase [Pseudonocardia kujensis]MCE0767341.1 ester cyclase [Pseudonocardia kujensis]